MAEFPILIIISSPDLKIRKNIFLNFLLISYN